MAQPAPGGPTTVYFRLSDGNPKNDVVAGVSNPVEIQHARDAIAKRPTGTIPFGPIIMGSVQYNPGWHFYFDPSALKFVSFGPASCNITAQAVETAVTSGKPLPLGKEWCPWGARAVEEVSPP